jgi:hypothetical protein
LAVLFFCLYKLAKSVRVRTKKTKTLLLMRITKAQLEAVIEWLNKELKRPLKPYENIDGKFTAQIGNFHMYSAYGKYGLHEMNNEHGGVKTIIHLGTKKELFNAIHRLLDGIRLEREVMA